MIAYLSGQIKNRSALTNKSNFLVLAVGGVGYKVFVLNKTLNQVKVGQDLELFVYTQVAEAVLDLYGFADQEELNFFELLISISGIGPKSALDILQKAKIEDLKKAAQSGQAEILSKISGLGPKTATKVVAGLKDKLTEEENLGGWSDGFGEALEALISLGYSQLQAREALAQGQAEETGEKIKEALKILAGKG